MAKSILDIIIRTIKQGGGDKETVKGLVALKQTIGTAVTAFSVFAGAAVVVDKVLNATVDVYVAYAQKVRETSLALGLSAEETSRVIALTDDLGISYEDLSYTIKKNADNTQFSIEGLARSSQEYLNIADAQERAKFAQERYREQWVEFSKLLEKGPDQVRAMADSIDQAHLFDDEDLARVEDYRMKTDQLQDVWEGFTMMLGEKAVPILIDQMNAIIDDSRAMEILREQGINTFFATMKQQRAAKAQAIAEREAAEATKAHSDAMGEAGQAAEELVDHYDGLLGMTLDLQQGTDGFAETEANIRDKMDALTKQMMEGEITMEEYNEQWPELTAELDANAKAAEMWAKRTVFSLVQVRLAASGGGIDAGEFKFLIGLGEQMGLIDEKTATMAQNLNDSLDDIDLSKPYEFYELWQDLLGLPHDQTFTINTVGSAPDATGSARRHGGETGFATGGAFDAGMPMLVHQDEIMVPDFGGVVLTRTDAMRLLSARGDNNSRSLVINNLTINAQGSVMDVLEELS